MSEQSIRVVCFHHGDVALKVELMEGSQVHAFAFDPDGAVSVYSHTLRVYPCETCIKEIEEKTADEKVFLAFNTLEDE